MIEAVLYIGAAVVIYLALLLHPLAKAHPVQALLVAAAWPIGGALIASYHVYLLMGEEDDDLPARPEPPSSWGRRR